MLKVLSIHFAKFPLLREMWNRSTFMERSGKRPGTISQDFLAGEGSAGVAGQKERDLGNIPRLDQIGNTLRGTDESFDGGRDELFELTIRHNPPRGDDIHADA